MRAVYEVSLIEKASGANGRVRVSAQWENGGEGTFPNLLQWTVEAEKAPRIGDRFDLTLEPWCLSC